MITLTESAAGKVKELLQEEGRSDIALRVAVQPGGCSGLRYQLFFDERNLDGDTVHDFNGVAAVAAAAIRPCIALAGQVLVGSREMRALGVESAYAMVDLVGKDTALQEPHTSLAALAERVARTWSR